MYWFVAVNPVDRLRYIFTHISSSTKSTICGGWERRKWRHRSAWRHRDDVTARCGVTTTGYSSLVARVRIVMLSLGASARSLTLTACSICRIRIRIREWPVLTRIHSLSPFRSIPPCVCVCRSVSVRWRVVCVARRCVLSNSTSVNTSGTFLHNQTSCIA